MLRTFMDCKNVTLQAICELQRGRKKRGREACACVSDGGRSKRNGKCFGCVGTVVPECTVSEQSLQLSDTRVSSPTPMLYPLLLHCKCMWCIHLTRLALVLFYPFILFRLLHERHSLCFMHGSPLHIVHVGIISRACVCSQTHRRSRLTLTYSYVGVIINSTTASIARAFVQASCLHDSFFLCGAECVFVSGCPHRELKHTSFLRAHGVWMVVHTSNETTATTARPRTTDDDDDDDHLTHI